MGWPVGWTDLKPLKNPKILPWDKDPAEKTNPIPRTTKYPKNRTNRLKAIGNGIVPQTLLIAIHQLKELGK